MRIRKILPAAALIILANLPGQIYPQNISPEQGLENPSGGVHFSFYPGEDFKIIKKFNLRIKKDSRYSGSVFREYRQLCKMTDNIKGGADYSGRTFIFEEQKREGRLNAKQIDKVSDTDFTFYYNGKIKTSEDSIYPLLRDFPVFPEGKKVARGDKWQDFGDFYVDPLKKGIFTKIRFICEYRYDGLKDFNGRQVHAVYAQYALRYRQGDDPAGDFKLKNVSGSHKVMIYLEDPETGPFFIQDNIDEIYTYSGTDIAFTGFSHTWYKPVPPLDRTALKDDIEKAVTGSGNKELADNVTVEKREEGVALTLKKLHFRADEAVLLPGEENKIKIIADILKKIPERTFLVTGHTADIGTVESQIELSVKRAETIAEMLKNAGISADRLIFQGKGGSEPAASNETEEGRALNRRVEIIILED